VQETKKKKPYERQQVKAWQVQLRRESVVNPGKNREPLNRERTGTGQETSFFFFFFTNPRSAGAGTALHTPSSGSLHRETQKPAEASLKAARLLPPAQAQMRSRPHE